MSKSYVIVGNFSIDNIVTADGNVSLRKAGGNGIHSAVGTHIWTNEIELMTSIPENYPSIYLRELEKAGIGTKGVKKVSPAVNLEELFFYDKDGDRADRLFVSKKRFQSLSKKSKLNVDEKEYIIHEIKNNPESGISFSDFRRQNNISTETITLEPEHIKACHIAPNDLTAQSSIASYLKAKGIFVTLDPPLIKSQIPETILEGLLCSVDCFLPSLKELKALYNDIEPLEAIKRLSRMGPMAIGVKLGEKGSLIWSKHTENIMLIPAYKTNRVVDLTGAGDAYCGGFMVGMQETGDPFIAAKYGTISASLTIEKADISSKLECNRKQALERLKQINLL